ncbi:MAG: polyprenyl diphosphate synthase [Firmicutes bacterium]|nr:polyprenyl diphosphate synthase [Bacillota bacterium]
MQIEELNNSNLPKHIALVIDGNRRWAKDNGLTTKEGHKAGAKNLENIAKFCNKIGIKYLTAYVFSTENWKRSKAEVAALMLILKAYLDSFARKGASENIKINIIGEKENISKELQDSMNKVAEITKDCTGLVFNVAFNYGGRAEIIHAVKEIAQKVKNNEIQIEDINEDLVSHNMYIHNQPDPDLYIRTSGELRTSNFLPWQLVYSELYFVKKHWPAFTEEDLIEAIKEYQKRNRRLGR